MRRILLIAIFSLLSFHVFPQYITAYEDYRKYFYVFDGVPHQLESQAVIRYKVAGNQLVYINNANELRTYYNGETNKAGEGLNANLGATGNLLYYTRDNALTVIDKGKLIPLSYFMSEYKAGDNIIAFKDSRIDLLKVYYKGEINELEYTLVSKLGDFDVGDNTVAFINGSHVFKVYYEGETYELSTWEPVKFICGRDMVAYIDGGSNEFNLFFKDKVVKLENFPPLSMQIGDNVVAYVSDENYFKVYADGKLLKLESYAPDSYVVKDNIVAFTAENRFQVVYNGTRYELETFQPRNIIISNNSMAYLDNAGRLKMFSEGKTFSVTTETVESFELNGDVLKYYVSGNTAKVYYKGKNY
jgi:hypothetical protein